jgi:hypothetical protein
MEFGKCDISDIQITSTINKRLIVKVGCEVVACNDAEEVVEFLREYLTDRDGIRRRVHGSEKEMSVTGLGKGPDADTQLSPSTYRGTIKR